MVMVYDTVEIRAVDSIGWVITNNHPADLQRARWYSVTRMGDATLLIGMCALLLWFVLSEQVNTFWFKFTILLQILQTSPLLIALSGTGLAAINYMRYGKNKIQLAVIFVSILFLLFAIIVCLSMIIKLIYWNNILTNNQTAPYVLVLCMTATVAAAISFVIAAKNLFSPFRIVLLRDKNIMETRHPLWQIWNLRFPISDITKLEKSPTKVGSVLVSIRLKDGRLIPIGRFDDLQAQIDFVQRFRSMVELQV